LAQVCSSAALLYLFFAAYPSSPWPSHFVRVLSWSSSSSSSCPCAWCCGWSTCSVDVAPQYTRTHGRCSRSQLDLRTCIPRRPQSERSPRGLRWLVSHFTISACNSILSSSRQIRIHHIYRYIPTPVNGEGMCIWCGGACVWLYELKGLRYFFISQFIEKVFFVPTQRGEEWSAFEEMRPNILQIISLRLSPQSVHIERTARINVSGIWEHVARATELSTLPCFCNFYAWDQNLFCPPRFKTLKHKKSYSLRSKFIISDVHKTQ